MRILLLAAITAAAALGQAPSPAKWTLEAPAKAPPGSTVTLKLKVAIDPPWHLYSPTTPPGPIPTSIQLAESAAVSGVKLYQTAPTRKYDPNFQSDTETYEKETTFLLAAELARTAPPGPLELTARLRYQMCDDRQCLPPKRITAAAVLTVDPAAPAAAFVLPAGYSEAIPSKAPAKSTAPAPAAPAQQPLGTFLLVAFGAGLAAIFTPCVFPMIPITMSFFLKKESTTRAASIVQAAVFCLGIVVLFTALGAATTAILGPFGVVQIGSNPWVNGFITVVFVAFALSLLGAFEITLPSGLLTKMTEASGRGGYLGTLLMGLTFALTSFACVGPFVGSLLAASIQGDKLLPLLGMASFSSGLASPFFFLALFPSFLQKLPRSGGWLARVKVVLGFVLLALAIKYASNVDQVLQTGLITRDRFLAAWVVLFALPGLYLLGFLLLPGVKRDEPLSITRTLFAAAFLAFAISLLPGMFGGRLGDLDAFIPTPSETSGFAAGGGGGGPKLAWMKNQYAEALAKAKAENKLLFVNFTGYACTNCHWMKANMFPRPEIQEALGKFVLLELYTDGADAQSEANQALQSKQFNTVAIPFYAILDGSEKVVASFPGLTRDPAEFLKFLSSGQPAS